jgi:hypothetical protein
LTKFILRCTVSQSSRLINVVDILLYLEVLSVLAAGVTTNGQKKDSGWVGIWGLNDFVGSRPVVPEWEGKE